MWPVCYFLLPSSVPLHGYITVLKSILFGWTPGPRPIWGYYELKLPWIFACSLCLDRMLSSSRVTAGRTPLLITSEVLSPKPSCASCLTELGGSSPGWLACHLRAAVGACWPVCSVHSAVSFSAYIFFSSILSIMPVQVICVYICLWCCKPHSTGITLNTSIQSIYNTIIASILKNTEIIFSFDNMA